MEITDNGHGFEPERVSGGLGLQNIKQSVEQLNGNLYLSSGIGASTTISNLTERELEVV